MDSRIPLRRAFCIVRPPGHHAGREGILESSNSQGFCIFNSIAIGALYALETFEEIERVAIVDFDIHHGDGTQDIVQGRKDILFISSHAYDDNFYPFSGSDDELRNVGNVLNIPLDIAFASLSFRRSYQTIVYPALEKFKPNLIFVSAGFDARKGDSLAPLRDKTGLLPEDYYAVSLDLARIANKYCQGRIVSALEGGYGSEALAECSTAHTSGFMDAGLEEILTGAESI
jgi:acetoin utilization deacetylase AcuC-like enzyme